MPPSPEADRNTDIREAPSVVADNATFDFTVQPGIIGLCKDVTGLPPGLMSTGRHFDNATVPRAGHAYEQD